MSLENLETSSIQKGYSWFSYLFHCPRSVIFPTPGWVDKLASWDPSSLPLVWDAVCGRSFLREQTVLSVIHEALQNKKCPLIALVSSV